MRKALVVIGLGSILVAVSAVPGDACGDKLLLLGRGIRFQSRHTPRPASVLLYLPASVAAGGTLTDPKLESALREAGHALRSASTRQELDEALRAGQYDVVLSDLAHAADLRQALDAAGSTPVVVPVVYLLAPPTSQQKKADVARAKKEFSMVLQMPGRPGHYCATVDKAMELKLKRERSKPPRT